MDQLTVVALLFKREGHEDELERFEASAVEVMRRFGGRLERRVLLAPGGDAARPDEVHVLTFPDRDAFERYRRDPHLVALASLRASAIRETTIWLGVDGGPPTAR